MSDEKSPRTARKEEDVRRRASLGKNVPPPPPARRRSGHGADGKQRIQLSSFEKKVTQNSN